jgi:hypothetical protein
MYLDFSTKAVYMTSNCLFCSQLASQLRSRNVRWTGVGNTLVERKKKNVHILEDVYLLTIGARNPHGAVSFLIDNSKV